MRYLLILALFLSFESAAQWKNYQLTPKKDTINRVDLKGLKQGPWVVRVESVRGEEGYEEEGIFIDDRKEGPWRRFTLEGDLIALENYHYGMKNGKNRYFLHTGEPLREESWRAIDPKNPYDTIDIRDVDDPSKVIEKRVIKVEPNAYKHGTWTYYNTTTGGIESSEVYVMNRLQEEEDTLTTVTDDELAPIDPVKGKKTAKPDEEKKTVSKPKEVEDYEKKNSGKKKIKVRDGRTGG